VKLPLDAQAGIPEMWLVNLPDETVEFYAQPANGSYQVARASGRGRKFSSDTISGFQISADEIPGSARLLTSHLHKAFG